MTRQLPGLEVLKGKAGDICREGGLKYFHAIGTHKKNKGDDNYMRWCVCSLAWLWQLTHTA